MLSCFSFLQNYYQENFSKVFIEVVHAAEVKMRLNKYMARHHQTLYFTPHYSVGSSSGIKLSCTALYFFFGAFKSNESCLPFKAVEDEEEVRDKAAICNVENEICLSIAQAL